MLTITPQVISMKKLLNEVEYVSVINCHLAGVAGSRMHRLFKEIRDLFAHGIIDWSVDRGIWSNGKKTAGSVKKYRSI